MFQLRLDYEFFLYRLCIVKTVKVKDCSNQLRYTSLVNFTETLFSF